MNLLLVIVPALLLICLTPISVEAKTYKLDEFSFEIPKGCKVDQEKNRFEMDNTNLDCGDNKEIVFESGTYDELFDMNAAPQDMVSELEGNIQILYGDEYPEIFESGADKYTINNHTAPYALATWTHTGHNLFGAELTKDVAGMMIAIKIAENKVVLAQYLAPQEDFDKFLSKAEGAFESVKAISSSSSTESETEKQKETDNSFTNQGDDLSKTKALCDTVTTQSAKDLCETLLN